MSSSPPGPRSLRVLLADDGAVNRVLGARLLEAGGHRVSIAANGRQAVDAAVVESYDLILMDLHMPVVDGFTAAVALRARGNNVVIIGTTATAEDLRESRLDCLDAGMNGFLEKPFSLHDLDMELDRVRRERAAKTAPVPPETLSPPGGPSFPERRSSPLPPSDGTAVAIDTILRVDAG